MVFIVEDRHSGHRRPEEAACANELKRIFCRVACAADLDRDPGTRLEQVSREHHFEIELVDLTWREGL